jgi:5'-nucleotidase / UDP-sugar diphosphatase
MFAKAWVLAVLSIAVIVAGIVAIATHTSRSSSDTQRHSAAPHASAPPTPPPATPAPATPLPTSPPVTPTLPPTPASQPVAKHPHHHAAGQEPETAKVEAAKGPITYVVKPGDNLWDIAQWFHLHGYGALYQWNRQVIGDNPRLIRPGEKIIVSAAGNDVTTMGGS